MKGGKKPDYSICNFKIKTNFHAQGSLQVKVTEFAEHTCAGQNRGATSKKASKIITDEYAVKMQDFNDINPAFIKKTVKMFADGEKLTSKVSRNSAHQIKDVVEGSAKEAYSLLPSLLQCYEKNGAKTELKVNSENQFESLGFIPAPSLILGVNSLMHGL